MFKEGDINQPEIQEKYYREDGEVNGVKISVYFDTTYKDYVLYLPQIEVDNKALKKKVYDQVFRISSSKENAKKVYDYAVGLAKSESDIFEIYKKAEEFARELNQE